MFGSTKKVNFFINLFFGNKKFYYICTLNFWEIDSSLILPIAIGMVRAEKTYSSLALPIVIGMVRAEKTYSSLAQLVRASDC